MKKIVLLLLILTILFGASGYIFFSSKIKIASTDNSSMKTNAATRYLLQEENWRKWWPGGNVFQYGDIDFILEAKKLNSFEMHLVYKKDTIPALLQIIPLNNDSTAFFWSCEIISSNNPFTRWVQYFNARHIKKCLNTLIGSLKNYIDKEENVYGFKVKKTKVMDSVLISTRHIFINYPDDEKIAEMVQQLKNYIKIQNAAEKNYPMLNVHQSGTNEYEVMVAIATDKLLPATAEFAPKLVLKGGNILEAGFKGGPTSTKKAFEEFENYKLDYHYISPAIPYQLMVTDRMKEKDTNIWITKFYYPIF